MQKYLAVLVAIAACGDDGVHHLSDGPPPPDAPAHDAPNPTIDAQTSGPVSVTVTVGGVGQVEVAVYFQTASSQLVAMKVTNASGTATQDMEPGGYVTVVDPFPRPLATANSFTTLETFAGVKPGDHLTLSAPAPQASVTFDLTLPVDANAFTYDVRSTCGFVGSYTGSGSGFTPGGPVTLAGCNGTADLLVETFDPNGAPSGTFYHPGQALADGVPVVLTDTYVPVPTQTLNYTHVPAGIPTVFITHALATARGELTSTFFSADTSTGSGTVTLPYPGAAGALSLTSTEFPRGLFDVHTVLDWGPVTNPLAFDFTNVPLPQFSAEPTLDLASHSFTWAATAGAIAPDVVVAAFSASRTTPTAFAWSWEITGPATGTTFVLPVLPVGIDEFNPTPADAGQAAVSKVTIAKVPGGYDAVRNNILALGIGQGLAVGATGRVVIDDWQTMTAGRWLPSSRQPRAGSAIRAR